MNCVSELFCYFDPDWTLLEKIQKLETVTVVMQYLFRLCSSSEMTEVLRSHMSWDGDTATNFRKVLAGKGQIQKNLKFYVYERVNGDPKVDPSKYGLTAADAEFVTGLLKSNHKDLRYFRRGLEAYAESGYPPRNIGEFDSGLIRAYESLKVTAAKYANKSFRWVDQSGQLQKDDAAKDMCNFALYSIYRAYPEIDNFLHMKNIGIRAIHNRGVNILKEQSTQSRQRVFKNDDGTFRGDLLSFDHAGFAAVQTVDVGIGGAISVCSHLMVGLDGRPVAYERPTDVDRRRDLEKIVRQLQEELNGKSPKTFIRLLMGECHSGFSKWLGRPNDEACDTMDRLEYAEKVRQYLDIPKADAKKFVEKLRVHLADFRN